MTDFPPLRARPSGFSSTFLLLRHCLIEKSNVGVASSLSPLLLLIFLCAASFSMSAQTFLMDGTDITTCSGFFTDSGGENSPYQNNESYTTTICSDGTVGTHVRLQFFQVDIDALDLLCFYDGPTTASPSLDCHIKFTDAFIIQATAANPTGCITVTFESDDTGIDNGWYAAISCVASCQLIASSMEVIDPAVPILDTGYNFIDVCPGQPITLSASGVYSQNGLNYIQSDSTSSFSWDFGNGNFASGPTVSVSYPEPGGYELQVRITDTVGCISTNYLNTFVRVSGPPDFYRGAGLPNQVCPDDTIQLKGAIGSIDTSADLSAVAFPLPYLPGSVRADSLALPDGNGVAFETSILLTEYLPGAVLENVLDLFGICIVMEHSWLRDLLITITCPSGNSVTLQEHLGNSGTEIFLGEPYEDDEGMEPVPGIGYEYCWTPTATNGTWLEYVQATGTDELPAGDYSSYDPLDNLLGCPLNGEWTITIEDLWGFDNGYVFSWGLSLNPDLLANKDSFFVGLADFEWVENAYTFSNPSDSIAFSPPNGGIVEVPFRTTDEIGCVFDTVLSISVRPPTDPDCHSCGPQDPLSVSQSICPGDSILLDASAILPNTDSTVTFELVTLDRVPASSRISDQPYRAPLLVSEVVPTVLTNPQNQICEVCFDIETPQTGTVRVFLEAPGGQRIALTEFHGNGPNFQNTCFRPGAATPISAGTPPFTGQFAPDGNWNALFGTGVTGTWNLLVEDSTGQSVVRSWSLCVTNDHQVSWQWSPVAALSCTNCPAPFAFPDTSSFVVVEASDRYGCQASDSIAITVKPVLASPVPICSIPDGGQVLFSWPPVVGAAGYLVSVNNGVWQAPNGVLSHLVSGLAEGEVVEIALTVVPAPDFCVADTVFTACQYTDPCPLSLVASSVVPPSCFNTEDGQIEFNASDNQGPVTFKLEQFGGFQQSPLFSDLPPGTYVAVVQDAAACTDTVVVEIISPDTLRLDLLSSDATCAGIPGGSIQSVVTGSQGNVTYFWSGPNGFDSDFPFVQELEAGIYCLDISDEKNCTQSLCDTILQPTTVEISTNISEPFCHDGTDGSIEVVASGGTPGYVFTWGNPQGAMGPLVQNLSAGIYSLTITDDADCEFTFSIPLSEPPPLIISGIQETPVSCNDSSDGSLLAEISGGVGPYTVVWSDPASQQGSLAQNLAAGNYEVSVTDANGCTQTESAEVTAPDPLEVTGSASPVVCFGDETGSISLSVQGGSAPFSFAWSSSLPDSDFVNGLAAGVYSVVATDSEGCQGSASFEVSEPSPLSINVQTEPTSCHNTQDGVARLAGSGGMPPYSYAWGTGLSGAELTGLAGGSYSVTMTDGAGCELVTEVVIEVPGSVAGTITLTAPACAGGADGQILALGTDGTPPFLYSLDESPFTPNGLFQGLIEGAYSVAIQDVNGCEWVDTVDIDAPPPLVVDAGPDLIIDLGDSVVLNFLVSGAQGMVSPVWQGGYAGTLSCDTCAFCDVLEVECPDPVAQPDYSIWYTISVADEAGCMAEDMVKVTVRKSRDVYVPTGFTPNNDGQNDLLIVHGQQDVTIRTFRVYDRWGEQVFESGNFAINDPFIGWDGTFRGETMPTGVYVWVLEAEFLDGARLIYQGETTLIR